MSEQSVPDGQRDQRAELESDIASELRPNETLVWVGQPSYARFRGEIAAEMAIGAFLTLISLGLLALWIRTMPADGQKPASLLPLIALVGFGLGGVYCLMAPRRYRSVLGRTIYAITTRRALMVNGFGHGAQVHLGALDEPDRSFGYRVIQQRQLKRVRRDGSGDIILDVTRSRGGRGRYTMDIGFFGVTDVARVNGFLELVPHLPMVYDLD